jgi:tetratricopeptide (TPR) repeat protein
MSNPRLHYLLLYVAIITLLSGCFGGKAPVVRAETQQRADTALVRGVRAEQKGNYPEAETLLAEAVTISTSIEDLPGRTTALINLARLHRLQRDLPGAERYMDQVLVLVRPDSLLFAEAAHEKALLELAKGDPSKALVWAQKSIAAEQGDLRGSRRNLAGRIQLVLDNWTVADSLARTALVENRSAKKTEEEANSLRIMGIVARNEKKYPEGEQFLREALAIDKRIGRSGKIATDLEELATTAQGAGNWKGSAEYLERAYDVNLAAGRLQQAMQNQEALAGIYSLLGDTLNADKARETVRKLAAQVPTQQNQGSSVTINPSSRP